MFTGTDIRKAAVLAGLCLLLPLAGVQAREFTSKNGTVMQAELVSHKDGKVKIRRTDGKEFEVDPSIFCAADEQFIRKWMAVQPVTVEYKLTIDADKKMVDRNVTTSSSYSYWSYEIKVTNNGQDNIPYLKVQYRVLYSTSRARMLEGDAELTEDLAFNRTLVVTTKPLQVYKSRSSYYGYRYGEIKGCLVRLLDREGKVIDEWVSSESAMRGVTWDNCDPEEPAGSKAEIR